MQVLTGTGYSGRYLPKSHAGVPAPYGLQSLQMLPIVPTFPATCMFAMRPLLGWNSCIVTCCHLSRTTITSPWSNERHWQTCDTVLIRIVIVTMC